MITDTILLHCFYIEERAINTPSKSPMEIGNNNTNESNITVPIVIKTFLLQNYLKSNYGCLKT